MLSRGWCFHLALWYKSLMMVNFWRVVNLKHELEELTIMEKFGYDYNIAHLMDDGQFLEGRKPICNEIKLIREGDIAK